MLDKKISLILSLIIVIVFFSGCDLFFPRYELIIDLEGQGAVHRDPAQTKYDRGSTVKLEAVAAQGWKFSHWSGDFSGQEALITITMNSDKYLKAVFVRKEFQLTIDIIGEGEVHQKDLGILEGSYPYQSKVRLTTEASTGWEFKKWQGDYQGSEPVIEIVIDQDKNLTAEFVKTKYQLATTIKGSGTIEVEPLQDYYYYGDLVTLRGVPATDWEFWRWTEDVNSYQQEIQVFMDADKNIQCEFVVIDGYYLEIEILGEGMVKQSPIRKRYAAGEKVNLEAISAAGWEFDNYSGDVFSSSPVIDIIMDDDKYITAEFVRETYQLTVQKEGEGTVNISPQQEYYYYGEQVTLQAVAETGWVFKRFKGAVNSSNHEITVIMDQDKTIIAEFEREKYQLNITMAGEGSVEIIPKKDYYYYGDEVKLRAIAANGWQFKRYKGDISATTPEVTVFIDGNKNIIVEFERIKYYLDLKTAGEGSIKVTPLKNYYYYGEKVTLKAIPASNWVFSHWSGYLETAQPEIEIIITQNISLTAHFVRLLNIYGQIFAEKEDGDRYVYDCKIVVEGQESFSDRRGEFSLAIPHSQGRYIDINISRLGYHDKRIRKYVFSWQYQLDLGDIFINMDWQRMAGAYGQVSISYAPYRVAEVSELNRSIPLNDNIIVKAGVNQEPLFEPATTRLIVVYHDFDIAVEQVATLHQDLDVTVIKSLASINAEVVAVDEEDIATIIGKYEQNPFVKYAEIDEVVYAARATRTPNDEFYNLQWHYPLMYLDEAWHLETGFKGVRVAVVDSGIIPHPDLFPAPNNPGNINWGLAESFIDNNPYDLYSDEENPSHGSHIAGIIGALTNNQQGVAAVSWDVDIVPIKALEGTTGFTSDLAAAIRYAADIGSDVIHLGWTTSSSQTLLNAIYYAYDRNSTLIAAVGNNNSQIRYPAAYAEVIAVGAVDSGGSRAPYSNYGPEIDIVAPGGRIISAENPYDGILSTSGFLDQNQNWQQRYVFMEGTSFASAHVAGVAALMIAHGLPRNPDLIKAGIIQAGLNYPQRDNYRGYGLLDAYQALIFDQDPIDLKKVKVFAGYQEGSTIYIYSEITNPEKSFGDYEYQLWEIDPGLVNLFAWYDSNNDGKVNPGDYFVKTSLISFAQGQDRNIDLNLNLVTHAQFEQAITVEMLGNELD